MKTYDSVFTHDDVVELWQSTVGIERETLRVNSDASFARTPHPKNLGNRTHHPYIQTDFAENQLEFITPPANNSQDIIHWLEAVHQIAFQHMAFNNEHMWPFSMPPQIPDVDQIRVAQLDEQKEQDYRTHLIDIYGHQVQLLSGIHYNFQINPDLLAKKITKIENFIDE